MLNVVWLALFCGALVLALINGTVESVTGAVFSAAKDAVVVVAIPLIGLTSFWLGFLRIAEAAGLVDALARSLKPVLGRLFPEVPAGHPALGAITLNMAANMLGLGNAATPFGLRAMRLLDGLNPVKGVASNAMCTFLAVNTASIQIIPATAISILAANGSKTPSLVMGPSLVVSFIAFGAGIAAVKLLAPFFPLRALSGAEAENHPTESETSPTQPRELPPLSPRWKLVLALLTLLLLLSFFARVFPGVLPASFALSENGNATEGGLAIRTLRGIASTALPALLLLFPVYATGRGVKVYEQFVDGAKEGFDTVKRVIPYLVAILVAVRMFREAGGIDALSKALGPLLAQIGMSPELLPMSLVRPLSGSATTGLFTEIVTKFGADSLISRTAATIYGSTETTLYVLSVYFGSVNIQRGRQALPAGLIADFTAVLASVWICRWFFGSN
jgi:spore maturation protein SpmA